MSATAFQMGYDACKAGKPWRGTNPFKERQSRAAWADGYAKRAQEEADQAKKEAKQ